ncbi:MAG: hypothetical protein IKG59_03955, partial [Firmicutes bacterium]|nr:hypothetical protein [Bacillota bacterium]
TEQWQKEHYGEAGRKAKAEEAAAAAAAAAAAEPVFEQPKYEQPPYEPPVQSPYQQGYAGPEYGAYGAQPYGNDKAMGIIAYFTIIGFLIALFAGANNGRRSPYLNFHLNQALVLMICNVITGVITGISATIGGLLSIALFVLWVIALVGAAKGEMKPVPVVGGFKLIR